MNFWSNILDPTPKRLIEVDLPIKRISVLARRGKSIRHRHISTLPTWWHAFILLLTALSDEGFSGWHKAVSALSSIPTDEKRSSDSILSHKKG